MQPTHPVLEDLELRLVLVKGTTFSWPGYLLMGTGECVCRLRRASEQPASHMMQEDKAKEPRLALEPPFLREGSVNKSHCYALTCLSTALLRM